MFLWIDLRKVRMRKIYCTKGKKYKEFKNPKISFICDKTLFHSSICSRCGSEDKKIFKVEESIEVLKILSLIYWYIKYKMKDKKHKSRT